ncbi:MAG: glycosyltransferase [Erysipelotrichaceae bacterium]|nr:glycosyltransferase [Erysipelotrichaceae bacterium]
MKKALIVTALARFVASFLTHDIELLQSMGYEVHCAANINHPGAEIMENYFKEHQVVFHQVNFSSYKPISMDTIGAYMELKKVVKEIKFDVVHCHTPIAGAVTRLICQNKRKNGMKVIYTTHGFYFHSGSSKKSWLIYRTIEDWMSYFSDAIITINQEDFCNAKNMHCRNVFHINGVGVDTNKFVLNDFDRSTYRKKLGILPNQVMVLSVGELSERKNQRIVVEALGKLKNDNLILVHCGNAMNKAATKDQIVELAEKLNVNLKLLGLRNDIPEICKCADIGTISSTREGLGLAGIEMLASGLPVVASRVHGILDYMQDGTNGYLANPYSSEEFANGIGKLVDESVRESMRGDCIESARKFDKKISFSQMEKIYNQLLM